MKNIELALDEDSALALLVNDDKVLDWSRDDEEGIALSDLFEYSINNNVLYINKKA